MPLTNRRHYANAAPQQTLANSIGSTDTSLIVAGSFTGWPSTPFFAGLEVGTANFEIVSVTAVVGTTATISRGQDGTAGLSHSAGSTLDCIVVRQDVDEANAHSSTSTGVHGLGSSSTVVGTTDVQTLNNKTLNSPVIQGGTINNSGATLSITNATTTNLSDSGSTFHNPTLINPSMSGNWDSGWQNFGTINGSWSVVATPQYRLIGNIVFLQGSVSRTAGTPNGDAFNGTNVLVLPSGYQPASSQNFPVLCDATNGGKIEMRVGTDGGLQFRNTGTATVASGTTMGIWCSFPVG